MENLHNDPSIEHTSNEGAQENKSETTNESQPVAQEATHSGISFDGLETASLEELALLFQKASQSDQWIDYRNDLQKLIAQFDAKYDALLKEKKQEFLNEGGNSIDFYFKPPVKETFDKLLKAYRQQKSKHYQEIEQNQKANQERKEEIIDQIKELIGKDENINQLYTQFKNLQESWYKTGPAPRNINNSLWQTFKHHVERFYDFVHLNRELRAKDFEHNYQEKLKIIEKAESLAQLADIVKAGRDLDRLHRQWKEDLGPVAKEHREALWKRFKEATNEIHKRKQEYQKNFESIQKENLAAKEALLQQMKALSKVENPTHNQWQKAISKLYELREAFKNIGPVPKNDSKRTWSEFREVSKEFNQHKNEYYRQLKNSQRTHIQKAKTLLEEVNSILEADNWRNQSQRMKSIQNDWKNLGPIPRKLINKLRKEFQDQCNLYFDRLKSGYQKLNETETPIYEKRQKFIQDFDATVTAEDTSALLDTLNTSWEQWLAMEPLNEQALNSLNQSFQKSIHKKIRATKGTAAAKDNLLFDFNIKCAKGDSDRLNTILMESKSQYEGVIAEITQLENNLGFFNDTSDNNPLAKEVKSKIEKQSLQAQNYQNQLTTIRQEIRALKKAEEAATNTETEGNPTDTTD